MLTPPSVQALRETLGVVGGMGPLAALRFLEHILANTSVVTEREHIRVVLDNDPGIPSRLAAYRRHGASPIPHIIKSIEMLASVGAGAVAIPCNAVHYFYDQMPECLPVPWLNMLEAVSERVSCRLHKPLVLGAKITVTERLYSRYLPGARYLAESDNLRIFQMIESLKVPGHMARRNLVDEICSIVGEAECDGVLLACTELTDLGEMLGLSGMPVVDTSVEYARAVIEKMRPYPEPINYG